MKMETRAKKRTGLSIKGASSSGSRRSILKAEKDSPQPSKSSKTESPRSSRSTGELISEAEASPESAAVSRAVKPISVQNAGPSSLAESTPKRASNWPAGQSSPSFSPTRTPQDKPVFPDDEFSPIELFPYSQSVPLVHWDWNPNRTPLKSSLRKSRRLNAGSSSTLEVPAAHKRSSSSPEQGPPSKKPTTPAEIPGMSLLEIELRAVNAIISQLETGGKDKLKNEGDNFFGATEAHHSVVETAVLKPEDQGVAASSTEFDLCVASHYHTTETVSVQHSSQTKASTSSALNAVNQENVEEKKHSTQSTSNAQIINSKPLKRLEMSSKLTLNNSSKVPVVCVAETNSNETQSDLREKGKEMLSPLRSAFYQDDSLTECLIACSIQVEEECRKSQELAKKTQPDAASSESKNSAKPAVSAALSQQRSAPLSLTAVSRTMKATSNSISSNITSSSTVSSLPPTCSVQSIESRAPVSNTFTVPSAPSLKTVTSAMLPPRRSPRTLSVTKKQSPHKRSMSPPRKIPVVRPPPTSIVDVDFNPSWMESIKIATSPLNCSLSSKSMSQSVIESKKLPSQTDNKTKKLHDNNKSISRTLFASKASPPNSRQKAASSSSTVNIFKPNPSQKNSPHCSKTTATPPCKRNASLDKSIDPFEDSFDTAFEDYEKIEAQILSQVAYASQSAAPSTGTKPGNEVSNSVMNCPPAVSNKASNQASSTASKVNSYSKSSVKDSTINNNIMPGFHNSFATNAGTKSTVVLSKPASSILPINKKPLGRSISTSETSKSTNILQRNSIESMPEKFTNQPHLPPAKSSMLGLQQTSSATCGSSLPSDATRLKVVASHQQGANSFPSTLSKPHPKTNSFPQWPPSSTSTSKPSQLKITNGNEVVHNTGQSTSKTAITSSAVAPQKSASIQAKNPLNKPTWPQANISQQSSTDQKSEDTNNKPFHPQTSINTNPQQHNGSTSMQKPGTSASVNEAFWQSRGILPKHKSEITLPVTKPIASVKQNSQQQATSSMQHKSMDNLRTRSHWPFNSKVPAQQQSSISYQKSMDVITNTLTPLQSSSLNGNAFIPVQQSVSKSNGNSTPTVTSGGIQNGHAKTIPQAASTLSNNQAPWSSSAVPKVAPHPNLSGSPLTRHKSADFAPAVGNKPSAANPMNQLRGNTSPLVRHRSAGDFGAVQPNSQRYSAEEIERKRQEAKLRLQQRRMQPGPSR